MARRTLSPEEREQESAKRYLRDLRKWGFDVSDFGMVDSSGKFKAFKLNEYQLKNIGFTHSIYRSTVSNIERRFNTGKIDEGTKKAAISELSKDIRVSPGQKLTPKFTKPIIESEAEGALEKVKELPDEGKLIFFELVNSLMQSIELIQASNSSKAHVTEWLTNRINTQDGYFQNMRKVAELMIEARKNSKNERHYFEHLAKVKPDVDAAFEYIAYYLYFGNGEDQTQKDIMVHAALLKKYLIDEYHEEDYITDEEKKEEQTEEPKKRSRKKKK